MKQYFYENLLFLTEIKLMIVNQCLIEPIENQLNLKFFNAIIIAHFIIF